ncbi:MAG: shikimate dehydrogenase [Lautropia sp.]|nr:shikimate dehydrogenase [Lautropia sp.]
MINGNTRLIAHIGYPTHTFKSPMIYNPYFEREDIDVRVVPFGSKTEDYPALLRALFTLTNIAGALITMPHKVTTVGLLDRVSPTAQIAGACNAVRLGADGLLEGDMFDGAGFVRGMVRKGVEAKGKSALVVGCGGVGSAIAASLAGAGVARMKLFDVNRQAVEALAGRLQEHHAQLQVEVGDADPEGVDIVVNATPLGMNEGDPMPMAVERISPHAFVGEVVLKSESTPFLAAARARGCHTQIGTDMLFEQIPAYLEYFGLPTTTAERLRELAQISY